MLSINFINLANLVSWKLLQFVNSHNKFAWSGETEKDTAAGSKILCRVLFFKLIVH